MYLQLLLILFYGKEILSTVIWFYITSKSDHERRVEFEKTV